ncbi:MAG: ABC transporter substrate-binding protein [Acidimicrobiaceae bacterium]|nr:ABC transporter substrate-binding protein [Acidimicrobiaceae bacterium]MDE0665645.1 ABC transporter substrate-binding protein [Acidimicrobiaceae bacterium]
MATTYPLTLESCGFSSTLDGPPESILVYYSFEEPLMLWGLGDNIDTFVSFGSDSAYPGMNEILAGLESTPDQPGREALVAMAPDLIITSTDYAFNEDAGFLSRDAVHELGIATWLPETLCAQDKPDPTPEEVEALTNRDFDQVLQDFLDLGVVVDRQAEAAELVAEMEAKMAEVEARVPDGDPVPVGILSASRDGAEFWGVYTGGVNEDIIRRAGGINPFVTDDTGQFASLSVEEMTVTPLDAVVTDWELTPEGEDALLAKFPTWPAAEHGRIEYVPGIVLSSPGLPWTVEQLVELLHGESG